MRHRSGHPSKLVIPSGEVWQVLRVSLPSPGFLPGSQFSYISPNLWHMFTPFPPFQSSYVLLALYSMQSTVLVLPTEWDTLTKMEMRKKNLNKFRCPEEKNSRFVQKILKEGGFILYYQPHLHFHTGILLGQSSEEAVGQWCDSLKGQGQIMNELMNACMNDEFYFMLAGEFICIVFWKIKLKLYESNLLLQCFKVSETHFLGR